MSFTRFTLRFRSKKLKFNKIVAKLSDINAQMYVYYILSKESGTPFSPAFSLLSSLRGGRDTSAPFLVW